MAGLAVRVGARKESWNVRDGGAELGLRARRVKMGWMVLGDPWWRRKGVSGVALWSCRWKGRGMEMGTSKERLRSRSRVRKQKAGLCRKELVWGKGRRYGMLKFVSRGAQKGETAPMAQKEESARVDCQVMLRRAGGCMEMCCRGC